MKNDIISQTIVHIFDSERFYAETILQMRRIINMELPAVAGVCVKENIELHVNPKLFNELSLKERAAVLKHECEHIFREHILRAKELAPEVYKKDQNNDQLHGMMNAEKHKVINISADCAINPGIADIPKFGITPDMFGLPNGETFEWYLANLKNNEKMKKMNEEYDSHLLWSDSEGNKEILREKIRQLVNKAAQNTRAAGCMSHDNELIISELNKGQTLNWRQQLKRFVAQAILTTLESSRKRRNRRYGIVIPGTIKIEDLNIGVAIDTSGSISNEELTQFMREIEHISRYAKVTVAEADCEIKNSYEFKKKGKYTISGRGGTAYKPVLDFFNEKEIDGLIYFGDMDNYDTEPLIKPKYPVLWAIVGGASPPSNFGKEVRVKLNKAE